MRRLWLLASVALCMTALQYVGAGDTASADASAGTRFPDYSREEQMKACLSTYGMENSSVVDCIARDEEIRKALSSKWADLDETFKKDCLAWLGGQRFGSYFFLDRCIQSSRKRAANPE